MKFVLVVLSVLYSIHNEVNASRLSQPATEINSESHPARIESFTSTKVREDKSTNHYLQSRHYTAFANNPECNHKENVEVIVKTNNSPGRITWKIVDFLNGDNVLMSGGPYEDAYHTYTKTDELLGCGNVYRFEVESYNNDYSWNGDEYTVKVGGKVLYHGSRFYYSDKKILKVKSWPENNEFPSNGNEFSSRYQLKEAVDLWANNKEEAIRKHGDIADWNVEKVTSMACLFSGWNSCANELILKQGDYMKMREFNADLSKWNVAKVTNMISMFDEAYEFNSDISKWDVGRVESFQWMFYLAKSFNSNLCGWNWDDGSYGYYKLGAMFRYSGCPNTYNPDRYRKDMCFDC